MLSENIRRLRESKGLSQGELAVRLNVVRQTVSKWERGLSVPDADLLIALSEALGQPVGALLGEAVAEPKADELAALAEKLEVVNLQLARQKETRRKALRGILLAVAAATALALACLVTLGSPYLAWDFDDPETAVAGTFFHAFEWVFVRAAPVVLLAAVAGLCLMRKRP
ncbi:helix-turn-helix domain-containing protein [Gordonibacter urolithinfaciens]|uniref:helix-turn-helix domain-containing protein n=1 Tax=Gordonibacter urolithinfaciens TaxID=1335613 RepID=UPI000B39FA7A|nr:helix-turn-helix transcriptional regulator [Gordonibacter urolithinfaciens]OUO87642.1 transcriptional regulator [Gordonibacter urolithinfaciens]